MPSFFSEIGEFFSGIWQSMTDGLLFLGGPLDMIVSALDILITSLVFYFILKLFRDSRAWQLLRGILLIIAFAFVTSFLGLNTISFLFNNTISILAIAVLIIFQPELRKTLEKLGRNRLVKYISPKDRENAVDSGTRQLIESIVSACESMSKTRTGALIIIERATRLGELQSQENAVQIDAGVSTTLLKQIFYTGSPLHDGAVLIRDDRIAAARIHVPLSDAYHLRHEFGTRHRAAVGASELGDAVAVVVSEERGTISLAIEGRLFELANADALRSQLYRLLVPEGSGAKRSFKEWLQDIFIKSEAEKLEQDAAAAAEGQDEAEEAAVRRMRRSHRTKSAGLLKQQRFGLAAFSFALAFVFWLYVQVTIDPVTTSSFNVPLTFQGVEAAAEKGLGIQGYPVSDIQLTLKGRTELLNDISVTDLTAFIDVSGVDQAGVVELPVEIETDTLLYTKTETVLPGSVRVNVYELKP
ncbi:MAG: TIGR00159 family protein [Clostridiaceae bacterium]|nr:TIGR00159 family protein [Clostridiaceae bacterium]